MTLTAPIPAAVSGPFGVKVVYMDEQWTHDDIAAHLGVKPHSVRRYRVRDSTFPAPDGYVGRTPWWRPEVIVAWAAARPGRTGRPPKDS